MKNDYDAPEGESFDEIYQSDGLRWMSVVVVLLVVFGFFSLAWYAWRTNTRQATEEGELVVVEADTSPYKEQPEDPGGMQFPHQDKDVYNKLVAGEKESATDDRLLPPPEEPMTERQITAQHGEPTASWINKRLHPEGEAVDTLEDGDKPSLEVVEAAPEEAAKPEPQKEAVVEKEAAPEKVDAKEEVKEAVKEKPKAEPTPEADKKRHEEVKAQTEVHAYVPPKPVVKPWMPKEPAKPVEQAAPAVDPIVAQAEKFAEEKQPPIVQAVKKETPAVTPPPATGGVEVQLAALRSHAEAETVWQKLSVKHGDVLGGKSHRIVSAEIPGKGTYYRLRVSTGSAAAAKSLCASLSSRNQACMVTR